jgi:nicotinamidase-related amidase
VLTGLITHSCVKATCKGALERGYEVVLVEDGHSTYRKEAATLIETWNQKLAEMGAMVQKVGEVTFL